MPPPLGLPQRLRGLDESSSDFPIRLADVLNHGFADSLPTLRGEDLVWLVEHLDHVSHLASAESVSKLPQALDVLPSTSFAFPLCLQKLREASSWQLMVPRSCVLAGSPPSTSEWPVTSGGFYDIYEESHQGSKVCVKRLRTYSTDKKKITKRVRYRNRRLVIRESHEVCRHSVKKLCYGDDWTTRISCPLLVHAPIRSRCFPFICRAESFPNISTRIRTPIGFYLWVPVVIPPEVIFILFQMLCVADGLNYLHSNSVIHGDLKGVRETPEICGLTHVCPSPASLLTTRVARV